MMAVREEGRMSWVKVCSVLSFFFFWFFESGWDMRRWTLVESIVLYLDV